MGKKTPNNAKISPKSTKAGAFQPKAFEIMSPLMAPCWKLDEEMGPMRGMYGTLMAELEV